MIRVFLGLMVNQEFQKSASLGPLDLRESKVFQEQKERRVVQEKWGSPGHQDNRVSQEPRENQD